MTFDMELREQATTAIPRPDDLSILMVRQSVSAVAGHEVALAASFYHHLFTMAPGVRSLFPADMSFQTERLTRALVAAVQAMHAPETLQPLLRQLGGDHAARYGVTDDMYLYVGQALVRAVREVLSNDGPPSPARPGSPSTSGSPLR